MKKHSWSLTLFLSIGLLAAGCGVNTSVHTTVHANGSGQIQWRIADTANNIRQDAKLTIPQTTALLTKYAPPGAVVSPPTLDKNGTDVWTITDTFHNIAQLNTIVQATTGRSNFHPISLTTKGPLWAQTFTLTDANNTQGHLFHWVSRGLAATNNPEANGGWNTDANNTVTLTLPWHVPPHQPSRKQAINNQENNNFGNSNILPIGIQWEEPTITAHWHIPLSSHTHIPTTITGTWVMSFTKTQWAVMQKNGVAQKITHWWHQLDSHGTFHHTAQGIAWKAVLTLPVNKLTPWGKFVSTVTPRALRSPHSTHFSSQTFWYQHWITTTAFIPPSNWIIPETWSSVGVTTPTNINEHLLWTAQMTTPLGGTIVHNNSTFEGIGTSNPILWQRLTTWSSVRWMHVWAVLLGIFIVLSLLFLAWRHQKARTRAYQPCPQCHHKNLRTHQFCDNCGIPLGTAAFPDPH